MALHAQYAPYPPPPAPPYPPQSQYAPPADPQAPEQPVPQQPAASLYDQGQLDQLLAPIALYPDQLLVQLFMASTYPLEVVLAERWVSDPDHAKLKGDQLASALEQQSWDPSVKSLVPFPPVLKMMSDQIDWTQRVGDAFLAQQKDLMDAVQRLRREAQAAGTLKTNEQQTVVVEPAALQSAAPPAPAPQEAAPAPQASAAGAGDDHYSADKSRDRLRPFL
jgi:hypothetical protein